MNIDQQKQKELYEMYQLLRDDYEQNRDDMHDSDYYQYMLLSWVFNGGESKPNIS